MLLGGIRYLALKDSSYKGSRLLVLFLMIWSVFSCGGNPAIDDIIEDGEKYIPPTVTPNESSSSDDGEENEDIPVDALIIAQWNIGHFSNGVYSNSKITGENFESKKEEFSKIISYTNADIFCVNEYSELFGTDDNGIRQRADEVLFSDYANSFVGHQSGYSCNAIFSKLPLIETKEIAYECNQTAVITHNHLLKAKDYYFIETIVPYKDVEIKLITTHLAFDTNNPEVTLNQIRELIERYKYDEYVILCGDWNTGRSSYDLFSEAGYQLGNHGYFGDIITREASNGILDNIITKGFDIIDFKAIKCNLSDHKPVVAALVLSE